MEAELRAARELVTELETAAADFDKRLEAASADGEKAASEAHAAAASAAKDLTAAVDQVRVALCFQHLRQATHCQAGSVHTCRQRGSFVCLELRSDRQVNKVFRGTF